MIIGDTDSDVRCVRPRRSREGYGCTGRSRRPPAVKTLQDPGRGRWRWWRPRRPAGDQGQTAETVDATDHSARGGGTERHPKLAVEPTIIVPPQVQLASNNMPNLGDPMLTPFAFKRHRIGWWYRIRQRRRSRIRQRSWLWPWRRRRYWRRNFPSVAASLLPALSMRPSRNFPKKLAKRNIRASAHCLVVRSDGRPT